MVLQKMNPVTVRLFDEASGCIRTKFLESRNFVLMQVQDMCLTTGTGSATAEKTLRLWMEHCNLKELHGLTVLAYLWTTHLLYNMGKHNSIRIHANQKNPNIYMMGCPCHIVHNTVQKAALQFEDVCYSTIVIKYFMEVVFTCYCLHVSFWHNFYRLLASMWMISW